MIEILIRSKNRNLPKFKSEKLFRFKKVQSTSTIREPNFLNLNTRVGFIKLR